MKAVTCPVCNGSGKYKDETCHGCNGLGWVQVQDNWDGWYPPHYPCLPYNPYPPITITPPLWQPTVTWVQPSNVTGDTPISND